MVFGQLVMPVQYPPPPCLSTALYRHDQPAKYHPVPWLRWHNASWHQVFRLPEGWGDQMPGNLKFRYVAFEYLSYTTYGIWFEMGPYGSIWAQTKTGRSHMAQEYLWTPPNPKRIMKDQKIQKNPKMASRRGSVMHQNKSDMATSS